ncbi:MAG: hypothetical protein GWP04_01920 [Gammaproteobacteria bacterium]|nr:hypothetical protein [Gammaproteobacteria bacterium]
MSKNAGMEIAVNLVQAYLRINGYLTITEFEVQRRRSDGTYETATDVDIVGLRLPGEVYQGDPHDEHDCQMLLIRDEELRLGPEVIDVILGEVKEGQAEFNPGLKRREVLHSVLRRLDWLYASSFDDVVDAMHCHGLSEIPARGGGTVRTRLVAFGRSPKTDLHTISLTHVVETMLDYLHRFEDVLRPANYKDPAPALLNLLVKTGFVIGKKD